MSEPTAAPPSPPPMVSVRVTDATGGVLGAWSGLDPFDYAATGAALTLRLPDPPRDLCRLAARDPAAVLVDAGGAKWRATAVEYDRHASPPTLTITRDLTRA